jgi:hypothetical protein
MDQKIQEGSRVLHLPTGKVGTVTRVVTRNGLLGGLAEVRWDGQRLSRSAGFQAGRDLREVGGTALRHSSGLVALG